MTWVEAGKHCARHVLAKASVTQRRHVGENVPKRWMIANRRLTQSLVATALVLSGVLAAWLAYVMEHADGETNKVAILLVALIMPCTIALVYITEIATTWLLDHWLEADREAIYVETFDKPVHAAMRRLEIVNQIPTGSLKTKIYCTSHCNLFANAGGRNEKEKVFLEGRNRDFFSRLAHLAMTSRDQGLRLLLQYADGDGSLEKELPIRIDIFLDASESLTQELYPAQFEARRLVQESVKDYFVIEDHVFKTIRKTAQAGGQTEFSARAQPASSQVRSPKSSR
jgi:hypothetical protein